MSRKGSSNSKFGHLFGDTVESSSTSGSHSRLSNSGDLYRDPLAALLPPVTATTTTTRSGTAKATLSPPHTSTTTIATSTSSSVRSSPPSSGNNSRSSSRLQQHALFSSLTGGDSSGSGPPSMFDSVTVPASSTLSVAKRDLLFGGGSSTGSSSSSRRTSTPPLPKSNLIGSIRQSTPPLGSVRTTVTVTTLDAEASPLGSLLNGSGDDVKREAEDDVLSIKSPLSAIATSNSLTRTNSQASTKSHESIKSSRSIQSQELLEDSKLTTTKVANTKPSTLSGSGASAIRSIQAKKTNLDQQQQPQPASVDSILNLLTQPSGSAPSPATSQSIETFQSISRATSPAASSSAITTILPPPLSKSGFERENDSNSSSPLSKSGVLVNVAIKDDAAEAFSKDLFFTSGPSSSLLNATTNIQSSSFLDTGFSSLRAVSSSSSPTGAAIAADATSSPGAGTMHQPKSLSGFSLGEDVSDGPNPWMNSLLDSPEHARPVGNANAGINYTQSDAMISGTNSFLPETAFVLTAKNTLVTATATPCIPSLEEDIGGFDEFASLQLGSSATANATSLSTNSHLKTTALPPLIKSTTMSTSTVTSNWNILDAVEAASLDPDFLGAASLLNQSNAKVMEIMQMPKESLEKDISAQEVFDNPWE
ncbi:hypothetical protein BX616_004514 [Lobosporangium transversale]|uniref:Uncharacterized protein n=1 Tax=Lobosporangium transversale TaxID=64571 RepID=A0A1Y2GBK8_9FUNG|nr:hypothetical protein BCR41DRAFT_426290 [Lobosporangium transversale]KAF9898085.1 hypothetical protein BX616_004514 [Lobosporangium transversale]ORZ00024.1 hypothetical protein BCR41DRAFT_426290 [Lobosporangium transversale]|eukprot:XP_021876065.1 hypothetical protein BCR41DRAFT_426290 [Lobosporangium transversale]